eukprot:superscaffoldBa00000001_g12
MSQLYYRKTGNSSYRDRIPLRIVRAEAELSALEKAYLGAVEKGDYASVKQALEEAEIYFRININCIDPLGRTALLIAIENENLEIIELLLSYNVYVGDALLHAIRKEVVGAVELLLNHKKPRGEKQVPPILLDKQFSDFTPDITPIILAAHTNNYEIIKLLVQRGVSVPQPHAVRCNCVECVSSSDVDGLRHSRSRLNIYKALSSPSLIALSSEDPFLTAFQLSWELKELSTVENEFKSEYEELSRMCKQFAKDLLDQTRSSKELEIILNYRDDTNPLLDESANDLARLKLAIKYCQKEFVAQPNCQQLLASRWYDEFPGWRRRHWAGKFITCIFIGLLFPLLSMFYLISPKSRYGLFIRKPFIKFICHTASYLTFLFLLLLASQHIAAAGNNLQGPAPTTVEWMILPWVLGFIWTEIKQMWDSGFQDYIDDWWNLMDFIMNSLYLATISLKIVAYAKYSGEKARSSWEMWHPTLVAEALFAIANIFSSLRLICLFTANSHLGPLQISLGRMLLDILKFLFIYCLVLLAFANGLNQLYFYYEDEDAGKFCKGIRCNSQNNAFVTLFETLQSLFWSIFGLVSLYVTNVKPDHEFTEFVGSTMFGTYNVISLVVLLNMLIAMMNNSYQHIAEVLRSLVKRYVAAMIRDAKTGEGLTEENFKELKQDISSFRYEVLGMMKGKSYGGIAGQVASTTLAYPGNSFKYSPKFSTDEPQQKLNVFGVTATVQSGAAIASNSECSNRLAISPVVLASAEKSPNKLAMDVSEAGFLQRQSRPPSQKCDEIYSLSEDDTLESGGQNQEFQTEKADSSAYDKILAHSRIRARKEGPNVCALQQVMGTKKKYFSTCRNWYQGAICGKKATVLYECCPGYMKLEGMRGCPAVAPIDHVYGTLGLVKATSTQKYSDISKLRPEIEGSGSYTFFAPSNDAWELVDETVRSALVSNVNIELYNALHYHMANKRLLTKDLRNGMTVTSMYNDLGLQINHYSNGVVTVNCARIIHGNQVATNGIVHVIDRVISSVGSTIQDVLEVDDDLTTLSDVAQKSGLLDKLGEPGHFTLFAPTNEAFESLGSDVLERLQSDKEVLKALLNFHLLNSVQCSEAIMAGSSYETLEGNNIEIGCDGDSLTVNGIKMVLKKDIVTTNGVIHLIDQVLMPDSAKQVMELLGSSQSTFADLVSELGLSATMRPDAEYTLLAPVNAAFNDEVMSMDQSLLGIILENHILKNKVVLGELYNGQQLETIGGKFLRVFIYRTAVCIENSCLIRGSKEGSNGALHLMRTLLKPAEKTMYEILTENGGFK